MLSFLDYLRPTKHSTPTPLVPDEYLERLDRIARQLNELSYQNTELRRTMTRVETKLTKLGIAAGYPDAVARNT